MFDTTDTPAFQAAQHAPAGLAFGVPNTHLGERDSALLELEAGEQDARKADARKVAALARIDRDARRKAAASNPSVKRGNRAAEDSMEYRDARADAATTLRVSEQTIAAHLVRAATLTSAYPTTAMLLERGEIDIRHVATILDAGHVIGPVQFPGDTEDAGLLDAESQALVDANRAKYEARVLVEAVKTTSNRLAPVARRIAEAYALEDLETRYERARAQRRVWVTPKYDGMAELTALLPMHVAKAGESRLLQMAKQVSEVEARSERETREVQEVNSNETGTSTEPTTEPVLATPRRSLSEIKADLFVDLLLNGTGENATGGPGSGTGISAIVQVITHEAHLTDPDSNSNSDVNVDSEIDFYAAIDSSNYADAGSTISRLPLPEIEGCGPIPVSMARDLAADAGTWSKVTVNLKTGTVLTVDTYRPSERIRRFLAARDQRCRFPGCRVPVHRCDIDHTIDAALGGPTSTTNLGAACRGHHMLKHHSDWNVKQHDNGDYEWTSPTGRTYIDEPVSRVRFVPVEDLPTYERTPPEVPGTIPPETREPRAQGTTPPETEDQGRAPSETSKRESGHPF